MKSGGYHLEFSKVKDRFAQILSQIPWLNIGAIQAGLKSVIKSVIEFFKFKKPLKKGQVGVVIIFNH